MAITKTESAGAVSAASSSLIGAALAAPSPGQLVIAAVQNVQDLGSATIPTLEAYGANWTQTISVVSTNGLHRLTVFSAVSTGLTTGQSASCKWTGLQARMAYVCAVFANADNVVQNTATAASTVSNVVLNLAPFGASSNAAFGAFGMPSSHAWTTGAGFTTVEVLQGNLSAFSLFTEWRTTPSSAIAATGSTLTGKLGIGLEIGEIVSDRPSRMMLGVGR